MDIMSKSKRSSKTVRYKRSLGKSYIDNWQLLVLFLPGLITLILFSYASMFGLLIAFKDYRIMEGVFASPWVGFEHFHTLFGGKDFPRVLRNTLVISISKLIVGFPMPIILALLLNEMRNKLYKSTIQTLSYLPHFFSWVTLGGIMLNVFSYNGPFNSILKMLGMNTSIDFFGNNAWFIVMLLVSSVWSGIGWSSIVYLASLSAVDESLYEAAMIDGAGRWKQTLHISIPTIMPTITTVLILNMGSILNGGFDQIFNMYNATVYEWSDIIDTYVYRQLESMDYSLGTAMGLFKSVVSLILVLSVNKITKKINDSESAVF